MDPRPCKRLRGTLRPVSVSGNGSLKIPKTVPATSVRMGERKSIAYRLHRVSSEIVMGDIGEIVFYDLEISRKVMFAWKATSLQAPAAPKTILGFHRFLITKKKEREELSITVIPHKNKQPENLEMHKDALERIIEIGLVEILSTQMACHVVANQILDIRG